MNSNRLKSLNDLLKDNPDDPFIKYGIAMEYIDENPEKSLGILEKLIEEHPDYLPVYYTLSNLLYEEEDYQNALAVAEKGIEFANSKGEEKAEKELSQLKVNIEFSM